jgi:hypothetical protein
MLAIDEYRQVVCPDRKEETELTQRSSLGNGGYWSRWVAYDTRRIADVWAQLTQPSGNPSYRPQYCFELARTHWEAMLRRYSAGCPLEELPLLFDGLLRAWEESIQLGEAVFTPEQKALRRSWSRNLDFYICCFWLTGLALALDIPEEQWQRLLMLMGNEGEDVLLDRVIATRAPGRHIGSALCHPKPYARLLAAVDAPSPAAQAQGLRAFVEHWHAELDRKAKKGMPAIYNRPYWHRFGDENFEGGAYFGRWCVEAVAAVKAFGLDDSACLGHPHYPGDLLRPLGPSTHPGMQMQTTPTPASANLEEAPISAPKPSLWKRWLRP